MEKDDKKYRVSGWSGIPGILSIVVYKNKEFCLQNSRAERGRLRQTSSSRECKRNPKFRFILAEHFCDIGKST
ncbi:MAG: hypothetical protein J6A77_04615, partial [Lachnospiraceae bacterium]|nr:hypothetical protein [Lachnospiraceae bacterium]